MIKGLEILKAAFLLDETKELCCQRPRLRNRTGKKKKEKRKTKRASWLKSGRKGIGVAPLDVLYCTALHLRLPDVCPFCVVAQL